MSKQQLNLLRTVAEILGDDNVSVSGQSKASRAAEGLGGDCGDPVTTVTLSEKSCPSDSPGFGSSYTSVTTSTEDCGLTAITISSLDKMRCFVDPAHVSLPDCGTLKPECGVVEACEMPMPLPQSYTYDMGAESCTIAAEGVTLVYQEPFCHGNPGSIPASSLVASKYSDSCLDGLVHNIAPLTPPVLAPIGGSTAPETPVPAPIENNGTVPNSRLNPAAVGATALFGPALIGLVSAAAFLIIAGALIAAYQNREAIINRVRGRTPAAEPASVDLTEPLSSASTGGTWAAGVGTLEERRAVQNRTCAIL